MPDSYESPQTKLLELMLAPLIAQSVGTVAKLGVADCFQGSSLSTAEIARAIGADEAKLRRCLRVCASVDVFTAEPDDHWALTRLGESLKTDSPDCARFMTIIPSAFAHWTTFGRLAECVKTGRSQAKEALGAEIWEYYEQEPAEAEIFGQAMKNMSAMSIGPVLEHYDFALYPTIVDVGGAYGTMLAAILRQYPQARGVLLDLPNIVAGADPVLAETASRVSRVGGNFLEDPLPAGDCYVLKHVLHNWTDEQCITLLKSVREAMNPGGRVVIVEMFMPDDEPTGPVMLLDLAMMVIMDSKERTNAEFASLCASAGLKVTRTIPTGSAFGIIEAEAL